ncbi:MAG: hypothetical protein GKS07_10950 [Nitrosopumilus sp.]|nr:MAG: hypothetical protein GKS07_00515 [Nitrosopumilus sp.]QMU55359.1 MAG: hypothetical protein GKS07_10950 [Nitrosopumilus sp.]
MALIFNLVLLGIVSIVFLKSGGDSLLGQGFSLLSNVDAQTKDAFKDEKAGNELKSKDRQVEDS